MGRVISENEWISKFLNAVHAMIQIRFHGTRAFSDYILYAICYDRERFHNHNIRLTQQYRLRLLYCQHQLMITLGKAYGKRRYNYAKVNGME